MTRDAVLDRVKRGTKLERADLQGIDLSKASLAKALMDRTDLDGANLEAADLSGASLKRATLREAYLAGANLSGANLENADLEGAKLERAILAGANLARCNLEGAILTGADLRGARLSYAQLASANLGGANLQDVVLTHAQLDDAYLGGAHLERAQLTNASLASAGLEEARLAGAHLDDAVLRGANLRRTDLAGASLVKADFSGADLSEASLINADLRHATLTSAHVVRTRLTGAKVGGLVGTGGTAEVDALWVDASDAGDGSRRIDRDDVAGLVSGKRAPAGDPGRRYFGPGDVLRNATLQFGNGARVEIDSLFDNCTINVGEGTELVVGEAGVLADCEIVGAGNITVHGKFFERKAPGIVGPRRVRVSAKGAVVSAVAQHQDLTGFSFERGCKLRMKVMEPRPVTAEKVEAKS
jgi:uncharacterized protein YjbI with pentapeptide repeats